MNKKNKYNIILADPPWKYDNQRNNNPAEGGMTYPTMSLEEIKELPIKDITDKNCSLFIWITMPKLPWVFSVIEAWGFRYITCAFTWVKINSKNKKIYSGLGHWTNGNAELCLFAKKGSPKRIEKNVKQIQVYPRTKHSAKPIQIKGEIIRLVGDLPRIELFAREKTEGWDIWGNELDNSIILK